MCLKTEGKLISGTELRVLIWVLKMPWVESCWSEKRLLWDGAKLELHDVGSGDLQILWRWYHSPYGKIMEVPVGDTVNGRVVDPIGRPVDGPGYPYSTRLVQVSASPGVMQRKSKIEPRAKFC